MFLKSVSVDFIRDPLIDVEEFPQNQLVLINETKQNETNQLKTNKSPEVSKPIVVFTPPRGFFFATQANCGKQCPHSQRQTIGHGWFFRLSTIALPWLLFYLLLVFSCIVTGKVNLQLIL